MDVTSKKEHADARPVHNLVRLIDLYLSVFYYFQRLRISIEI